MGTGITGTSQIIAGKHHILAYFSGINNKHYGRFFDMVLAAQKKRNNKEMDCIR